MPEILLKNVRRYSDIHFRLFISDGEVPVSWDSTTIKRLFMYSEKQRGFGGKCSFQVNDDPHYLDVTFHADNQQFLGIHRVVIQIEIEGNVATYDARVCNIVASTSNEPDIYDEAIDVPIHVSMVDTTVMYEILAACRLATADATAAADRADGVFDRMSGGRKNEVLTKLSNDPLDIGWKPSQGGGNSHPYLSLERLRHYLYRVTFDALPEDNGGDNVIPRGCSSFVQGGKLHRNLDFNFDNAASFIVRTRDFEGMSFLTGLNDGEMDDELVAQLPYRVVDGRNNNGIMVSTHVLFNDWSWTGSGERGISLTRLPFLVLTNVKSMETIAADLADVLGNLYASEALQATGYLLQVLVTDGTTTYAILPPTSAGQPYVLQDITANPKLANFRWVSRGTVSRADADLQTRPTGVERWNMMPCPLEDLRFTAAYEDSDRLSEFIGIDGTTKASSDAELLAIYQRARAEYLDRRRDGKTWQTMHSVVYGDRMEHLYIQEDWSDDIVASGTSKEYVDGELARVEAKIPDISGLATLTQLHEVADSIPAKVSDLTNDSGFQTASQVAVAVSAETSRATDEEARIEALSNKVVLNGMTASEDGSTVKLSLAKINIKTGATSSVDVPLPVVDANGAGILNPQTYQTIISNQTLINAIIGASVAVSGLAAEPTQAQVTTAWLTASGEDELVNGARLFDVTNTKVWTYYTNTELWYPVEAEGSVEVAQWTNSALGTVKGVTDNTSHTNDGKLTAETDGTGSVLGWDRLVARVQTIENNEAVWNGKYDKPSTGIPSTDMTTEVQTTLGKVTVLESEVGELANPTVASSVPTGGLLPETLYELGTLTGTASLPHAAGVTGKRNHYFYTFETGATVPIITWDSTITKWYCPFNAAQSGAVTDAPILSANKHYEVSVIAGNAAVMEM